MHSSIVAVLGFMAGMGGGCAGSEGSAGTRDGPLDANACAGEEVRDLVTCEGVVHLSHDEVSCLGFSADDVLATIEGAYDFPIIWFDPCKSDGGCGLSGNCDKVPDRAASSLAGSCARRARRTSACRRTRPRSPSSRWEKPVMRPVPRARPSHRSGWTRRAARRPWR